jgi:hypothetical protein
MKQINFSRVKRLMESSIDDFALNLRGISVLTEAASGPFVVTPLIAALSGSDCIIAVTRNSRYGRASEIKRYIEELAKKLGVQKRIIITGESPYIYAKKVHLVTNLGFVRPIDERVISCLPEDSAISLMCEPWEYRKKDVDIEACRRRGIPVAGTFEEHSRLQIFRYIGLVVLKLLFEKDIEVFRSNILLIGSGKFGIETKDVLLGNGATVLHVDPYECWGHDNPDVKDFIEKADAIVIVEHQAKFSVLGGETGIPLTWLSDTEVNVIHVCGNIDDEGLKKLGKNKYPPRKINSGYMTVTTDYLGPRSVVDLHAAGLKVGETLVKGMRLFKDDVKAVDYALKNSPAMEIR